MSKTLRIALVAEGITDYVVIDAAVSAMLAEQSYDLKLLQPEESVAFVGQGNAGLLGGGWKGVYRWCKQAVERGGGRISDDPLFLGYDILILHLDADVAAEDPASDKINPIPELAGMLPCEQPCPPASKTTDCLRGVMLNWIGETTIPPRTVLCTPSKNTEAWIVAIFFPTDKEMKRLGWECHPSPQTRLSQQPKAHRFTKSHSNYLQRQESIKSAWATLSESLSEAKRFSSQFMANITS
jgi:hypothetical protein